MADAFEQMVRTVRNTSLAWTDRARALLGCMELCAREVEYYDYIVAGSAALRLVCAGEPERDWQPSSVDVFMAGKPSSPLQARFVMTVARKLRGQLKFYANSWRLQLDGTMALDFFALDAGVDKYDVLFAYDVEVCRVAIANESTAVPKDTETKPIKTVCKDGTHRWDEFVATAVMPPGVQQAIAEKRTLVFRAPDGSLGKEQVDRIKKYSQRGFRWTVADTRMKETSMFRPHQDVSLTYTAPAAEPKEPETSEPVPESLSEVEARSAEAAVRSAEAEARSAETLAADGTDTVVEIAETDATKPSRSVASGADELARLVCDKHVEMFGGGPSQALYHAVYGAVCWLTPAKPCA